MAVAGKGESHALRDCTYGCVVTTYVRVWTCGGGWVLDARGESSRLGNRNWTFGQLYRVWRTANDAHSLQALER